MVGGAGAAFSRRSLLGFGIGAAVPVAAGLGLCGVALRRRGWRDPRSQFGDIDVPEQVLFADQLNCEVDIPIDPPDRPLVGSITVGGQPLVRDATSATVWVMLFVQHWCPHCDGAVRAMTVWSASKPEVRSTVVAFNTQPWKQNYPPSDWLQSLGWRGEIVLDNAENDLARYFGVDRSPTFVVVGNDNRVRLRTCTLFARSGLDGETVVTFFDEHEAAGDGTFDPEPVQ